MKPQDLLAHDDYGPLGGTSCNRVHILEDEASGRLRTLVGGDGWKALDGTEVDDVDYGEGLVRRLGQALGGAGLDLLVYSGRRDRAAVLTLIAAARRFMPALGVILIDHADLNAVYQGIREAMMLEPRIWFHRLDIASGEPRPGQGIAVLSFDPGRVAAQPQAEIPANKNRRLEQGFLPAEPEGDLAEARARVEAAVAGWNPADRAEARRIHETLLAEFPDQASPKGYWHEEIDKEFVGFFTWGHDQDFGHGFERPGAMGTRHLEILSEAIEYGYVPADLEGLEVLDVGCWTGGDVIALAGLGGRVTAIEEHAGSAAAAARLCGLLGVPAEVRHASLYEPIEEWRGRFDLVYISGVVYHVTDPLLALRICFAYLKPGGRLLVETKASGLEGSYCEYAGTLEKGWNWYGPTLQALGRWLVDAGFRQDDVRLHMRPIGRLLAGAVKRAPAVLPDRSGFSRPGSWLEGEV